MYKEILVDNYISNLFLVTTSLKINTHTHAHICNYSESESCSFVSDSSQPRGLYIIHGILQARILDWVAFPSPGDLPNPGIEPGSPALQADSLQPQGKPI